ncbi:MAG: DNA-directed RNA polymerase subunit beta [Dehalococcoidia bacterium]|nr:MAG: DNA-directed RNA polymerase subunit beta [Dehalococcoidia bacterium]
MVSETLLSNRKEKSTISRQSYSKLPQIIEVPNLIEIQLGSYQWFQEEGIKQLIKEISPIKDFIGSKLELSFIGYEFREPRFSEQECSQRDLTYSVPLYVKARLLVKATGEIKEPFDLFFGDIPLMTAKGTFITSGTERVIVSQLLRSLGVYFMTEEDATSGRRLCMVNLIPGRGAWLEMETSNRNVISVKIDGKRKIPVTTLLRAIGFESDKQLLSMFAEEEETEGKKFIQTTIDRDPLIKDSAAALIDIYRKIRPGDPPNLENAKKLINNLFFNPQHYDLGIVGRYKLNQRLGLEGKINKDECALTHEDLVEIVKRIIKINNGDESGDDIEHLGNRRIRVVGELIQNQFRIGLMRLERVARERMSILSTDLVTPGALVNIRPVVSAIREFFGGSQLSQFMDQTNPLAELTHKRRLSAMGPGGLSRERAGFDVRDVHFSHYGRICPIETPEGPNIGLIGSLATFGRINSYGFIETPYRKVVSEVEPSSLKGFQKRIIRDEVRDKKGEVIAKPGDKITPELASKIARLSNENIKLVPFVTEDVVYLPADKEDKFIIAQANTKIDEKGQFVDVKVEARHGEQYLLTNPETLDYMDVSPKQIFSVAASLIPFLEHNDANRALMGANMQRQAVPLLCPESPFVATGMEKEAAKYSGQVLFARDSGIVTSVTGFRIIITNDIGKEDIYPLGKFVRTNQGTCINQRVVVKVGERVEKGSVLADSSATENGELALGQNVVCAFMSWGGYNYEDAIIISERLVEKDKFTSIHISKHEVEARDTKLGPEEITRDIPNVGEENLRELDEEGLIRIGAEVGPGDILVGKITPKGETELSAEEKLLRAIFGEKAREVKDTSLRVPHGEWGKVIKVRVFSREENDELPVRVNKWVQVWVAQQRKISAGDKLAGRHGNKGVISIVAPVEDMPFLPDGTPVDIILNPIGVPSRMNIGQVLETHLGWAAQQLDFKALTPVFDGASDIAIEDALARLWLIKNIYGDNRDTMKTNTQERIALTSKIVSEKGFEGEKVFNTKFEGEAKKACLLLWLDQLGINRRKIDTNKLEETVKKISLERNIPSPISGKALLRDGRTGEPFDQPITVGTIYMMKLNHLVEDKVHARSTGPYSLISQQPLGGKAQFGGQRFGEMEVWSLEAYGAAHNLQEVLTIKSDDVTGRAKTYEAIVKGEDIMPPGVPESFKVLVKELQSLSLAVEVINEEDKNVQAGRESNATELENGPEVIEVSPNIEKQSNDEEPETEVGLEENNKDEVDENVSISPNVKKDIEEEGVEKDSA